MPAPLPSAPSADLIQPLLPRPHHGPLAVTPLPGDAGNRRYFRITAEPDRYILMQMTDPDGFKASEEATTGTVGCAENPFINMQRHLAAAGLPVPAIFGVDADHGLMLLEDLGDTSLMAAVQADPDRFRPLYTAAIDHLITLQRADLPADCIATQRCYDANLLMWEFDHYLEYGIEALSGRPIPAATAAELRRRLRDIADGLGRMAPVPVHRDYHSRNLMVRPATGKAALAMIDFQDALMGPASYDLASLLWDPYVSLPAGLASELAGYYVDRMLPPIATVRADFGRLLALTALQRLLKAAGRFVYIHKVKHNPGFLADIPACLSRAGAILSADPALGPLQTLLAELEPRLGPAGS